MQPKMMALIRRSAAAVAGAGLLGGVFGGLSAPAAPSADQAPSPLLASDHPVTWWVAFKFNAASFSTDPSNPDRACPFGGSPQAYRGFSQQYIVASSDNRQLRDNDGLIGVSDADPLGATFGAIYKG